MNPGRRPDRASTRARQVEPPAHGIAPRHEAALVAGDHAHPHEVLGAHVVAGAGVVVRAFHPEAAEVECLLPDGEVVALTPLGTRGLFAVLFPGRAMPLRYRLRFRFASGDLWEHEDPYRFGPTVGDLDLYLFGEGTHRRLWHCFGARARRHEDVEGVAFAVWAPGARRVSVVGDFCHWDGRLFPMRQLGRSGVYELFIPELPLGTLYKYEIKTAHGGVLLKTDPFASAMELPPGTAARVYQSTYTWNDQHWIAARRERDPTREPIAIYEVHLGSWARVPEEGHRPLTYREIAPKLAAHVKRLGFTHVELLPVMEHPFTGSWGYQVTGYYAPTARYGTPDDLRFMIDHLHREGIGVILDWVPAHFPKDDFALARFDGSFLYEHEDPRRGEHPDWGTLIFNYGRHEVRNFLIANALYWLDEFHADGLRVDAVASMLYLDYSRPAGQWVPNLYGGRENLHAIDFLRQLNSIVAADHPGCIMVAEESTAWPGVTAPTAHGGLGFTFKWNMGWMHDTLEYFKLDPIHRRFHQDQLTFAMIYEHSERFIMPLSHDEVVHGKGSLIGKMPGDTWQQFANLRLLFTYQFTRPGKKLFFMGSEFAQPSEWHHDKSLDWHLAEEPFRAGLLRFFEALGRLYRESPCLSRGDPDPEGFVWIDAQDRQNSVLAYLRRHGQDELLVALNLTPVPRKPYRVGVPRPGRWLLRFSSDDPSFGGSEWPTPGVLESEPHAWHGHRHSLTLSLPPLGALVLVPAG